MNCLLAEVRNDEKKNEEINIKRALNFPRETKDTDSFQKKNLYHE